LASKTGANLIPLGELIEKERLYSAVDKKRDTFVANMEKVRERVKSIIMDSAEDIIVEGHFAVDIAPPDKVSHVFVLRRDPKELKETFVKRGYSEDKIQENLAAEILDVCLCDAVRQCGIDKVCEVNVSGRKVEDVVEEIRLVIDGKKECKVGIVDWLGKLESEGKLDEYLKDI
jgi:adenylate kinase